MHLLITSQSLQDGTQAEAGDLAPVQRRYGESNDPHVVGAKVGNVEATVGRVIVAKCRVRQDVVTDASPILGIYKSLSIMVVW